MSFHFLSQMYFCMHVSTFYFPDTSLCSLKPPSKLLLCHWFFTAKLSVMSKVGRYDNSPAKICGGTQDVFCRYSTSCPGLLWCNVSNSGIVVSMPVTGCLSDVLFALFLNHDNEIFNYPLLCSLNIFLGFFSSSPLKRMEEVTFKTIPMLMNNL